MSIEDPLPRSPLKLAGLILLGTALFSVFVALGTWQVYRLYWKLDLIDRVNARVHAEPVALPGRTKWAAVNAEQHEYLPVRAHGHYLSNTQTLVHATTHMGSGYWVMTPLRTQRGFIVLVNRGFVSSTGPGMPVAPVPAPSGLVTVAGLLDMSEPNGGFLRPNDPEQNRWYSRDVAAIAASAGLPADNVAPYFVNADAATNTDQWPVGGLTVIHFRNTHLVYAITWYVLAGLVVVAAVLVTRFELQNRRCEGASY